MLGVDATNLDKHDNLKDKKYDKIIFNFPHCHSKMRLDLNRDLLKGFFTSSYDYLTENGQLLLSLCNGQGGTIFDKPQRKWNDSWKVKEMAAHGNFILNSVEPFVNELFLNYSSTGYRGLDKQFHKKQSLVHVFVKSLSIVELDICPNLNMKNLELENDNLFETFDENNLNPPIFQFDMTFTINQDFDDYYFLKILYNNAGRIIKNVKYLRCYQFPDTFKTAKTYRIFYHADDVPLYRKRVIYIHENIITKIVNDNLDVKFLK